MVAVLSFFGGIMMLALTINPTLCSHKCETHTLKACSVGVEWFIGPRALFAIIQARIAAYALKQGSRGEDHGLLCP